MFASNARKSLRINGAIRERAIDEVRHRVEGQKSARTWAIGVVADVVTLKVHAYFELVLSKRVGEIIDNLPLPDVTAVWKIAQTVSSNSVWRCTASHRRQYPVIERECSRKYGQRRIQVG